MNGFEGFDGVNDPFSKFWMDFLAKSPMAAGIAAQNAAMREDMLKGMRQAFFESWARACDEFLGSAQFLDMMKKSMDNALAFKQQVNEFMTKVVHEGQLPARTDTDSILLVVRSMEERVLGRLDSLSQRVAALEQPGESGNGAEARKKTVKK